MEFEGKLANRIWPNVSIGGKPKCGKCRKVLPKTEDIVIGNKSKKSTMAFVCQSYLGTDYYVYETRSGGSICYCSKYCAKKHNHRFRGNNG